MSYILDALKKVEHEKLRKSVPGGMTSIAGDLFQERVQQPVGGGRWKIIILIMVASSLTFAGTWFVLRDNKPKSAYYSSSAVKSAAMPTALPVVPTPSASFIVPPLPVQPVTVPVAKVIPPVVSSSPPPTKDDVEKVRPARNIEINLKQQSVATMASPQLKPAPQTIQPPADIKLSGIAWQDERAARRAVVNGFLLKEGAMVAGARVTEIMADRVRFSLPAGIFEIRLDVAPAAEVGR